MRITIVVFSHGHRMFKRMKNQAQSKRIHMSCIDFDNAILDAYNECDANKEFINCMADLYSTAASIVDTRRALVTTVVFGQVILQRTFRYTTSICRANICRRLSLWRDRCPLDLMCEARILQREKSIHCPKSNSCKTMKLLADPLRDFKVLSHNDTFENKTVKEKLIELHPSRGSELNEKLENIIQLPCCFGGLGIAFPHGESEVAYNCSREMCRPLLEGFTGEEFGQVQDTITTQFRRENELSNTYDRTLNNDGNAARTVKSNVNSTANDPKGPNTDRIDNLPKHANQVFP
ncbi:hypothetical protein GJ496_001239 [Pomphorhynchus laevis]|nr:hypothetical protein GJ496_001239 [Pomphorhynchus laevis]